VQACATHFLIPEANKLRATNAAQNAVNPAFSISGESWTVGLNGNPGLIYTTGASDISGTTAFGDLLVIRFGRGVGETSTWDIIIDGDLYPTWYSRASYDAWSQDCIIIPLKTRAAHTFVLRARQPSGGANVLESIDCVDTTTDFGATLEYSTPVYLNDGSNVGWGLTGVIANSASANSATGATAWAYGNGGADRFSAAVDQAMNELYQLGFNVFKTDLLAGWDAASHLNADTIHPNDQGHAHIAAKKRAALRRLLLA
jgi:hypothetical protein